MYAVYIFDIFYIYRHAWRTDDEGLRERDTMNVGLVELGRCALHQCINIAYVYVHQIIVISFKVPGVFVSILGKS